MAIHSSGQTIFGFTDIESIILGAGEVLEEFTGGITGMCVDRISEIGDRTSEEQAAGMYTAGITVGSLARVEANDRWDKEAEEQD